MHFIYTHIYSQSSFMWVHLHSIATMHEQRFNDETKKYEKEIIMMKRQKQICMRKVGSSSQRLMIHATWCVDFIFFFIIKINSLLEHPQFHKNITFHKLSIESKEIMEVRHIEARKLRNCEKKCVKVMTDYFRVCVFLLRYIEIHKYRFIMRFHRWTGFFLCFFSIYERRKEIFFVL